MDPMLDFTGKVALITGAASGFGKLLAAELGKRGARLVLAYHWRSLSVVASSPALTMCAPLRRHRTRTPHCPFRQMLRQVILQASLQSKGCCASRRSKGEEQLQEQSHELWPAKMKKRARVRALIDPLPRARATSKGKALRNEALARSAAAGP